MKKVIQNKIQLILSSFPAAIILFVLLPPHVSYFDWQAKITLWLFPLFGLKVLKLYVPHSVNIFQAGQFNVYQSPLINLIVYMTVALAIALICGLVIGRFFYFFWKIHAIATFIGVLIFISASLCFSTAIYAENCWISSLRDGYIDVCNKPAQHCEKSIDEATRIQILTYEMSIDTSQSFLLYTTDGGKNWQQFMWSVNGLYMPVCEEIGSFSQNFFWITAKDLFVFTHDRGKTWQFWHPYLPEANLNWGFTENVSQVTQLEFENENDGHMVIEAIFKGETIGALNLSTNDGGVSWYLVQN